MNYTSKIYNSLWQVQVCGCLLMGVISTLLLVERSPPLYHAYTAMTVFLWTQIFSEYRLIKALWKQLHGRRVYYVVNILATCAVSVFISEFLVLKTNITMNYCPALFQDKVLVQNSELLACKFFRFIASRRGSSILGIFCLWES